MPLSETEKNCRYPVSEKNPKKGRLHKTSEKRISPVPKDNIKNSYKPEKPKIAKRFELMEDSKEIDVQEIANKWICPHLVNDNSKYPYEPEKQKNKNHFKSKDNLEQLSPEILQETSCPMKDNVDTPVETEQVNKQPKSQRKWKDRLLHGIFRKGASSPIKNDSNISTHSTTKRTSKGHKFKLPWKKRFFVSMFTKN